MICKDKAISDTQSARLIAGNAYEKSVAFFLEQAFKSQSDILVFNDLVLYFDDERCQIDHLIVYRYGFVLIESKSLNEEVRVNSLGEWMRLFNRKWSNITSPIKHVEMQQVLLKALFAANASSILGKLIFNTLQQRFSGRSWDQLHAISANTKIDCKDASESVKRKLIKAELIVDRCKEIMNLSTSILGSESKFLNSRVSFEAIELENLRKFLIEADQESRLIDKRLNKIKDNKKPLIKTATPNIKPKSNIVDTINKVSKSKTVVKEKKEVDDSKQILVCKKCKKSDSLEGKYGKYGYYVHCTKCDCNTSMKINCPSCDSKNVKNRKEKSNYYVACLDCEKETLVLK